MEDGGFSTEDSRGVVGDAWDSPGGSLSSGNAVAAVLKSFRLIVSEVLRVGFDFLTGADVAGG